MQLTTLVVAIQVAIPPPSIVSLSLQTVHSLFVHTAASIPTMIRGEYAAQLTVLQIIMQILILMPISHTP